MHKHIKKIYERYKKLFKKLRKSLKNGENAFSAPAPKMAEGVGAPRISNACCANIVTLIHC